MRRTGSKCLWIPFWGSPLLIEVKLILLILVLIGAKVAHGATITVESRSNGQPSSVLVAGKLEPSDGDQFRTKTGSLSNAVISFRSDGGSVVAGIQIGQIIRVKGFTTSVSRDARCASACALAWLGGTKRLMSAESKIGFHAAYTSDGRETGVGNALIGAYLTKLGLPYSAVVYITQAAPRSMTWLSATEAKKHGIDVELAGSIQVANAPAPVVPATAPALPGPSSPGAGPAGAPEIPRLIYSPWTKFCMKGKDPNAKEVCFVGKDARTEALQPAGAAVLIEPGGQAKRILRVTVPGPVQMQQGARIIIDTELPITGTFVTCLANGCLADYEATPNLIDRLKKGRMLTLQAIKLDGKVVTFPLPLVDQSGNSFQKAHEGPPADPKAFEARQKKLQEELQKRAQELGRKVEGQAGGGGRN
jgi:invasion protein IalB